MKQQNLQERISRWLDLGGKYYDKADHKEIKYRIERPVLGGACMFGVGIAAGMLGIGAGAFKVSIHELILKMPKGFKYYKQFHNRHNRPCRG
jgi:uncharacterized protein